MTVVCATWFALLLLAKYRLSLLLRCLALFLRSGLVSIGMLLLLFRGALQIFMQGYSILASRNQNFWAGYRRRNDGLSLAFGYITRLWLQCHDPTFLLQTIARVEMLCLI